ncbi:MAG: translocation/assembly module TamB domain-containing protein [Candidatus Omnitrophica bacterium]|nr:translocation/assembly module TamB domain-containing protein [Candidatus Omnitrophota bacterium]
MPDSEATLFNGEYKNGLFDINAYSKYLGVRQTLDLFVKDKALENISGSISELDVYIKGSFLQPQFSGHFHIDRLSRDGFSLLNCPSAFNISIKDIENNIKLNGELNLQQGLISARSTTMNITYCKILFSGKPNKPVIDFKGNSVVEGVKIQVVLRGAIEKPQIRLASEPPKSQAQLLVMLATGKSWKSSETAIAEGRVTPELAGDLIDYLVFGGAGNKIANQFGISVKFDGKTKGIGITKQVSGNTEVSYGIEQTQEGDEGADTTHKIGVGQKITESISVEGERETKYNESTKEEEGPQADDKLLLKFKKQF